MVHEVSSVIALFCRWENSHTAAGLKVSENNSSPGSQPLEWCLKFQDNCAENWSHLTSPTAAPPSLPVMLTS
jgi:hypothetical protein